MPLGKRINAALPIALGVVMIGAGAVNAVGPASIRQSFNRWKYPAGFNRVTGGLEIVSGLLLLFPSTARLGAMGSGAILLAATGTVLRFKERKHLPGALILTAASVSVALHAGRPATTRR